MNIGSILLIVIILVLLYVVIRYVSSGNTTLSNLTSATTMQTIQASSLAQSASGLNSSNFTYSIWFYINDWNYKYGEQKYLYGRVGPSADGSVGFLPCPIVTLGAIENNVNISLATYAGADTASLTSDDESVNGAVIHNCSISNVPIQRWVNLLISVYGRTLDVYLDGKLVRTSVLPGIAKINQNANVYVTPAGGFNGWTSKFQYFSNSTDPQTAWNIYEAGYGQSWLGSLFGQYQVKVALIQNGNEDSSFTI
jgi:hypothetical protein